MLTAADTVNRLSDIQRTLSNIENTLTNMKKPKKKAIPVPRSEEPSLDFLMHNLTDVTIGTTLNIKLFIGGPIDLYLHSTSMYESPVNSPLVILFRPQQKTIVFNSLVADQFDIEEKRNIPMTIPNIIQLDIQLQETDIEYKFFDYRFKFDSLQYLSVRGASKLLCVEIVSPPEEGSDYEINDSIENTEYQDMVEGSNEVDYSNGNEYPEED
ncbi:hypothetical protein L5515_018460 [Caenorhabditis briggsae]|uniref:Uncharacterized protein n=1 Tax=Caenorhabditis briggsae TaxID=6238 RepID=A0AAE9FH54_CAEBR|nr:hypothetical protein L5515_018460 [Caenorhabditis briggsae]